MGKIVLFFFSTELWLCLWLVFFVTVFFLSIKQEIRKRKNSDVFTNSEQVINSTSNPNDALNENHTNDFFEDRINNPIYGSIAGNVFYSLKQD